MTTGRQRPPDGLCRGLYTDIMSSSADSLATDNVGTPDTQPMSVTVLADKVTSNDDRPTTSARRVVSWALHWRNVIVSRQFGDWQCRHPWHTTHVSDSVGQQCNVKMTTGRQCPPDGSCRGLYTDIMVMFILLLTASVVLRPLLGCCVNFEIKIIIIMLSLSSLW